MGNIFHENENKTKQKVGVVMLILDKIDFKTKSISTDKEGPSNFTSGYLSEETQNTKSKRRPLVHCSIILQ